MVPELRVLLMLLVLLAVPLHGQGTGASIRCAGGAVAIALPGGPGDESARSRSIRSGGSWSLARGAADAARDAMAADSGGAPVRLAVVVPELLVTHHSDFPMPANDGPMWAGRGVSYSITGGVAICGARGRWGAIVAPTYWYTENAAFPLPDNPQIVPPAKGGYTPWASRYYYMPRSLDAPRRFGPTALRTFDPGIVNVYARTSRVEAGFTTEPEWWGPGQYNALLLSTQAAGLPRVYVKTVRPIQAAGELDVKYFIGGMSYSKFFFENNPPDTTRSMAGLSLIWRPRAEPHLSIGVARLVMAPMAGKVYLRHLFDPIVPVGTPNAVGRSDSTQFPGRDQLLSVFANWRLPDDGAEVWVEWARAEMPESIRDFLQAPNHTQAVTLGMQRVSGPFGGDWTWRTGAEFSTTTQSSTYRERPVGSWYTSRAVQAGFSQKGQVIGAMIGPGSVTQRLHLDFANPLHSVGLFAYRIKWDDDSFYTIPRPNGNGLCKHDVSLAVGARGSVTVGRSVVDLSVTSQNRQNIYWQALGLCFDNSELQVDQRNLSVEFRVRPRLR